MGRDSDWSPPETGIKRYLNVITERLDTGLVIVLLMLGGLFLYFLPQSAGMTVFSSIEERTAFLKPFNVIVDETTPILVTNANCPLCPGIRANLTELKLNPVILDANDFRAGHALAEKIWKDTYNKEYPYIVIGTKVFPPRIDEICKLYGLPVPEATPTAVGKTNP